jgi:nucleoside 2-deoxyribosyltransferase
LIYLIGSLRNDALTGVARALRSEGFPIWDDWRSASPAGDDQWQQYETERGRTYDEALSGAAAYHTFTWDMENLQRATAVVLVLPAGKSAHMEFGWAIGKRKPAFVYFTEEPERWDVMYKLANGVYFDLGRLAMALTRFGV